MGTYSLAGKIGAYSSDSLIIRAVNHGLAGSRSGSGFRGFLLDSAATISNLRRMVSMWKGANLQGSHFFITTLASRVEYAEYVQPVNAGIRELPISEGLPLIDLSLFASSVDKWREPIVRVDGVHYVEAVRDWLAQHAATKIIELSPDPPSTPK